MARPESPADLAALVLAAGLGTRLRPLTLVRPKPLCPVANVALLDHALASVRPLTDDISVNAHYLHEQVADHVPADVRLSIELPDALGTAGAVANIRDHVDGRPLLVVNSDTWRQGTLDALLEGWDGERMRLLCQAASGQGDFGDLRYVGACLLPWTSVRSLAREPSGLYEVLWEQAYAAGTLDLALTEQATVDCGTPRDYLRANLLANGGESVIGAGATVAGEVVRSVVWPGGVVASGERLVESIRVGRDLTVDARG